MALRPAVEEFYF